MVIALSNILIFLLAFARSFLHNTKSGYNFFYLVPELSYFNIFLFLLPLLCLMIKLQHIFNTGICNEYCCSVLNFVIHCSLFFFFTLLQGLRYLNIFFYYNLVKFLFNNVSVMCVQFY